MVPLGNNGSEIGSHRKWSEVVGEVRQSKVYGNGRKSSEKFGSRKSTEMVGSRRRSSAGGSRRSIKEGHLSCYYTPVKRELICVNEEVNPDMWDDPLHSAHGQSRTHA